MTIRITVVLILLAAFLTSPAQVDARRIYDPSGNPPEGGWPIVVYLKGYGVTQETFNSLVEVVNGMGVSLIALHVNQGQPKSRRKAQWTEVIEPAHTLAQANLQPLASTGKYNLNRVYLAGYADGGIHAALAVMAFPEYYGGALAASPAKAKMYPDTWDGSVHRNSLFLIHAQAEFTKESVQFLRKAWGAGGGNLRTYEYPGIKGENQYWKLAVREGLRWIMNSTPTTSVSTR
jgi:predicted peptidase